MLNKDQQHRLDVASFVVWECDKAKHPVTNLKLQRILYLLYGQFWSRYKKELFPAHFGTCRSDYTRKLLHLDIRWIAVCEKAGAAVLVYRRRTRLCD